MPFDITKLAYCGIYCEQCAGKIAFEEQNIKHLEAMPFKLATIDLAKLTDLSPFDCEGCKGRCVCGPCNIKNCATKKQIDSCAECDVFPCQLVTDFANDGKPHHRAAFANLTTIREQGYEKWFDRLEPLLRCHCGKRQSWYYPCPEHHPKEENE